VLRGQVDEVLLQLDLGQQRVVLLSSEVVAKEELLKEAGDKHVDLQHTAQIEMNRCVSELILAEKKTRCVLYRCKCFGSDLSPSEYIHICPMSTMYICIGWQLVVMQP